MGSPEQPALPAPRASVLRNATTEESQAECAATAPALRIAATRGARGEARGSGFEPSSPRCGPEGVPRRERSLLSTGPGLGAGDPPCPPALSRSPTHAPPPRELSRALRPLRKPAHLSVLFQ